MVAFYKRQEQVFDNFFLKKKKVSILYIKRRFRNAAIFSMENLSFVLGAKIYRSKTHS